MPGRTLHIMFNPNRLGRQPESWLDGLDTSLVRMLGLLARADEDGVASQLDDADLVSAARQIRHLYASARHMTAA
jgi:hypothetical protein